MRAKSEHLQPLFHDPRTALQTNAYTFHSRKLAANLLVIILVIILGLLLTVLGDLVDLNLLIIW